MYVMPIAEHAKAVKALVKNLTLFYMQGKNINCEACGTILINNKIY